jgi:ubiquinone/menaquinone biosynthesis C-methylase UbiE
MVRYKIVKEHVGRERVSYPWRAIFLPALTTAEPGGEEYTKWTLENDHLVNFQVLEIHKPEANRLAMDLHNRWQSVKNIDDLEIQRILGELEKIRAKPLDQLSPLERWAYNARNMSEYSGNVNLLCLMAKALSVYSGDVLEVFCGHNSYFTAKKDRKITALDYCEESLTRFAHKKAKRICCDLNQVKEVGDLSFLEDNSFDAVSICFGYKYPHDIVTLMSEFRRILKPGGVLSFIESYTHAYAEIAIRKFDRGKIRKQLVRAGFSKVSVLPINQTPGMYKQKAKSLVYQAKAIK